MGGIAKGILGGGKQSASGSSSSQVVVPAWLDSRMQSLAGRAETLSNRQFTPNTLPKVFNFSPDTLQAFEGARSMQGRYQPQVDASMQGINQLFQRSQGPTAEDIQQRMNPYIQNVLDISKREGIRDFQRRNADLQRQKGLSGAFGGSRMAIQEAELNRNFEQAMNDMQTRGLFDAFNVAQNQFNRDTDVLGNAITTGLQGAQQGQQYNLGDIEALMTSGSAQQLRDQAQIEADLGEFDRQQAFDYDQLNFLSNILNPQLNAYRGETSTTTQTQRGGSGSTLGNIVGGILGGRGIFSDERVKENIEEVGELDNGLTIYKFNYKGDPTVQIGLIAQEVLKKNPEAVSENKDGILMVNYDKATQGEEDEYEDEEGGGEDDVEEKTLPAMFSSGGRVSREAAAKQLANIGINPLSFRGAQLTNLGSGDTASSAAGFSGLADMLKGGDTTQLSNGETIQWNQPRLFSGSGPGLDWADFGRGGQMIGNTMLGRGISSIGSFFGFAEGGGVGGGSRVTPKNLAYGRALAEKDKMNNLALNSAALTEVTRNDLVNRIANRFNNPDTSRLGAAVKSIPDMLGVPVATATELALRGLGEVTASPNERQGYQQRRKELGLVTEQTPGSAKAENNEAISAKAKGLDVLSKKDMKGPAITPNNVPVTLQGDASMANVPPIDEAALMDDISAQQEAARAGNLSRPNQPAPPIGAGLPIPASVGASPGVSATPVPMDRNDIFSRVLNRIENPTQGQEFTPPKIQGPFGEVNVPLLLAGIGMLSNQGNFFEQAGSGFKGYLEGKQAEIDSVESQRKQKTEEINDQITQMLNLARIQAEYERLDLSRMEAMKPEKGMDPIDRLNTMAQAAARMAEAQALLDNMPEGDPRRKALEDMLGLSFTGQQ